MRKTSWLVFALVFGWKIALFIFTTQPVPANDAFFYDSAVIHQLLHGGYYSPYIAIAFPVSGTEIFSTYPPGYQLPLYIWMSIFGTSAYSAMVLHLVMLGLYLFILLAVFRRLQMPAWIVNFAGCFIVILTFHDRPDSFAHLLGIIAVYACVRSRRLLGREPAANPGPWSWLMVVCIILTVTASFQIGGIYFLVVLIATVASCWLDKEPIRYVQLSLMPLVPIIMVLLVIKFLPRGWAGFQENAHQTPFLTGVRMPHILEAMKLFRTVPAIFLITVLAPLEWWKRRGDFGNDLARHYAIILVAALLPSLGVMAASLSILAANTVAIASYLQIMIVAAYLGMMVSSGADKSRVRLQTWLLVPAILLCSVRAIGMTTWGVACAEDVSYSQAVQRVEQELTGLPPGSRVVMSSAFLYGAAKHGDLDLIHTDWMARAHDNSEITDMQGLLALKPGKIIVSQFEYYRRYEKLLERAQAMPGVVRIQITNLAHVRPPDAYKSLQQVVQNISWAPVIVNLAWAPEK